MFVDGGYMYFDCVLMWGCYVLLFCFGFERWCGVYCYVWSLLLMYLVWSCVVFVCVWCDWYGDLLFWYLYGDVYGDWWCYLWCWVYGVCYWYGFEDLGMGSVDVVVLGVYILDVCGLEVDIDELYFWFVIVIVVEVILVVVGMILERGDDNEKMSNWFVVCGNCVCGCWCCVCIN